MRRLDLPPDTAGTDTATEARPRPRYRAFISYSHADRRWARWLMRRLEAYPVPGRLVGTPGAFGPVPKRLAPLFRDREELASASDLSARIREALADSEALVLIASPAAARSRWVNEEVLAYKRLGRDQRIFSIVVDGEPAELEGDGVCFPPALLRELDADGQPTGRRIEPIAADARPEGDGRRRALGKLVAGLLGVGYDDLRQREVQRRNRRLVAVTAASLLGMAVTIGLAVSASLARQDAERRRSQAEDLLGFMVGDLRASLEPLGRLDLLDKVGDEAMAYFSSVEPGDLTDDGLAHQATALTQIGEVRLAQARFDEAKASFEQAYARGVELVARDPRNGQRLFDRGQAEFWVGYVAWERGNVDEARRWFEAYLTTSTELVALAPEAHAWQLELAYAQHNLAVLELEHGDAGKAGAAFADQVTTLRGLDCPEARCNGIKEDLADAVTWQGLAALEEGRIEAAHRFFLVSRDMHAGLVADAAEDRRLEFEYADEIGNVGMARLWLGRLDAAEDQFARAHGIVTRLSAFDPTNMSWREYRATWATRLAQIYLARRDVAAARAMLEEAVTDFLQVTGQEAPSPGQYAKLARAYRLEAQLLLHAGEKQAALDAVGRALDILEDLAQTGSPHETRDVEAVLSLVQLADIQQLLGRGAEAEAAVVRARELADEVLADSLHPNVAEAWVRAHSRVGGTPHDRLQSVRDTGLALPGLWPAE